MIFSKKRKNEVKVLQNLGDFAHTASRRKTRFYHLTKKSFCIYGEKKSIRNRKIQTVKIDHIPMLVRDLEEKGTKEAIDE